MSQPSLLIRNNSREYLEYFKAEFCRKQIFTFDGIRVYFKADTFYHAFYECSRKDGAKDLFSIPRAQRMPWIRLTLESPDSLILQGWIKKKQTYDPYRRVAILYEDFVVILEIKINRLKKLKAQFITCFCADRSIDKIKEAPVWTKEEVLEKRKKGGR